MNTYYTEKRAQTYNQTWRLFTQKTLAATCSAINLTQLQQTSEELTRPLRILDVACGTGVLLQRLSTLLPTAELYGIDASNSMLAQAHQLLKQIPHIRLSQASLQPIDKAGLPYDPAFFDLITCTNTFHYLPEPVSVLQGLTQLLAPRGQLIIEDYARHGPPYLWKPFEWFIKRIDPQHIRASTLSEARTICQSAALHILTAQQFPINTLWQGWVIHTNSNVSHP